MKSPMVWKTREGVGLFGFFYVIVFSGLYLHLTAPGKHMAMCFI